MKRRKSDKQVRVYSYGIVAAPHPPKEGEPEAPALDVSGIRSQLFLSHRLWNAFVRYSRIPWPVKWPKKDEDNDGYRVWKASTATMDEHYRRLLPPGCSMRDRSRYIDLSLAAACRRTDVPDDWKRWARANRRRARGFKRLCKAANRMGLASQTYDLTMKAFNDAAEASKKGLRERPKCRKYCQYLGRVSVNVPASGWRWADEYRPNRVIQTLRVAGENVRALVCVHRQLPPDAAVKQAWIMSRKRGARHCYELQLVVESELFPSTTATATICGMSFGWEPLDDGSVRIACVARDDGAVEEVLLDKRVIDICEARVEKAESLQSIRKRIFTSDALQQAAEVTLGERVRKVGKLLHMVESRPKKLDWAAWISSGKAGAEWETICSELGEDFSALLEAWYHKESHLRNWQKNLEYKATAYRNEQYRVIASGIRRRFATIAIEDTELKGVFCSHFSPALDYLKLQLGKTVRVIPDDTGTQLNFGGDLATRAIQALRCLVKGSCFRTSRKSPAKKAKKGTT